MSICGRCGKYFLDNGATYRVVRASVDEAAWGSLLTTFIFYPIVESPYFSKNFHLCDACTKITGMDTLFKEKA